MSAAGPPQGANGPPRGPRSGAGPQIAAGAARTSRPAALPARWTLMLLAAITLAPVVASYSIYYLWPRDRQVNYGELLATAAPPVDGVRSDGTAFALSDLRGKWVLVAASRETCDDACGRRLYATRQARTMQGRDQDRVARILLVTADGAVDSAQRAEHPNLEIVRVAQGVLDRLPAAGAALYLVDPLGNLVLAWPAEPDIKALAKDLERLLRASRIG